MDLHIIFAITVLVFMILLLTGLPVAMSLGAIGVLLFFVFLSPRQLIQVANISYNLTTSETLIVVPMFLLMAQVISICNISEDFYDAVYKWLNWIPGSLGASSVITSAGFAAISGSSTAAVATIGSLSIPPMVKRNYNKKYISGIVTSGGALGILIPPSLTFIVYGFLTETSIVKLFIGGIVPGLLLGALLFMTCVVTAMVNPSVAPVSDTGVSWEDRWKSLPGAMPFMVLAALVSVLLYLGFATVTEVAGIGAIASLAYGVACRRLTFQKLKIALFNSVRASGMIVLIVIGGMVFSFVLTSVGIPSKLAEDITGLSVHPLIILVTINVLYIVLGCFLDAICILVITIPFLFPIVANLGVDPIWFGVITTINMEMGLLSPPVGLNLYVLRGVVSSEDLSTKDIIVGSFYFELILLIGLVLIILFPALSLWLPGRL